MFESTLSFSLSRSTGVLTRTDWTGESFLTSFQTLANLAGSISFEPLRRSASSPLTTGLHHVDLRVDLRLQAIGGYM